MSLIRLAGIERVFHLGDSTVHALNRLDVAIEHAARTHRGNTSLGAPLTQATRTPSIA